MSEIKTDQTDIYIINTLECDLIDEIEIFSQDNNIDDIRTAPLNLWTACMYHLYDNVIKGLDIKKLSKSNTPMYDKDKINNICDIYIKLCYKYDKEIKINDFIKLVNMSYFTLHDWSMEGRLPSVVGANILQKLNNEQETSLSNKAITGKGNIVGVLAKLNTKHGWTEKRETVHAVEHRQSMSLEDIKGQIGQING